MNTLVIGRCPKTAEQFKTFCNNVVITLDKSFARERNLPELDNYTIEYLDSNISTIKGIIPRAKDIFRLVKKYDVDVIFSNTKWDMVAAKLTTLFCHKKVFLFATNHNSYAWSDLRKVQQMSILIKFTTDCYVALASFVYNQLKLLGHKEESLVLIPNTVGYETWDVKDDYSYNKQFRIVYVAYVYPGKRQDMIADVLNLLKDKHDIVVDCYGDLDEFVDYVEIINKKIDEFHIQGKLNLKGKIENSELRSILKNYDAYFSASHMEMSPVNILEAQAAGLPVLAANVGGIPDVITDGETGLLFNVDDIKSAAQKLEELVNDEELREKIGRSGRQYVSEVYTNVHAGERLRHAILKNKRVF